VAAAAAEAICATGNVGAAAKSDAGGPAVGLLNDAPWTFEGVAEARPIVAAKAAIRIENRILTFLQIPLRKKRAKDKNNSHLVFRQGENCF